MKFEKKIIRKFEELATIFILSLSIFLIFYLAQALLLMWLNQFKILYISLSLFISSLLLLFFLFSVKNDAKRIPNVSLVVLSLISLISLILILFPHDSFGGRDEGMYSGLAMILSKHHSISIPSNLVKAPILYGSPDPTISLDTPVYVVWLATQKILLGVDWMTRSNVVLIFLGLSSLYLVSASVTKKSLSFIIVVLFSTSMPFLWFSRETMTENMAFFLLWFLILSLILFMKTKKTYFILTLFLSSWLFSFTRNEGLFIQIPILIVFTAALLIRKIVPAKKIFFISIIYLFLIVLSFFVNNNFSPLNKNHEVTGSIIALTTQIPKSDIVKLGERIPSFVFHMNSKQNLSIAIYSSFFVLILVLFSKKKVVEDKILYICLFTIVSLEFLKLINPSVTLEQPWMYRRYFYAILPFGYLSLLILLNSLIKKKLLIFITGMLLIVNIILSSKIITLENNWGVTGKIEKLTQNISVNDFVIIDGNVVENYYPDSYLAYHKEIRNLYDWWIDERVWEPKNNKYQGVAYSKLFLLSDSENKSYKDFETKKIGLVEIETKQLQPNCKLSMLRTELGVNTYNTSFFPYFDVKKYCSKSDNEIINLKKKLFLYELLYEH